MKYEEPKISVINMNAEDVITTSMPEDMTDKG